MTTDFGLSIHDFKKVISEVSEYIVVDIRAEDNADSEGHFAEAFQIEEYELPYDVNSVPLYFKNIVCVMVGDDPAIAAKWVNDYRGQDGKITQLYYLDGTAPELFELCPEVKE